MSNRATVIALLMVSLLPKYSHPVHSGSEAVARRGVYLVALIEHPNLGERFVPFL